MRFMMRKLCVIVLMLACCNLHAFDPVDPNPKKTMMWTVQQLDQLIIPIIRVENISVLEAGGLLFADRPASHLISFDFEKIENAHERRVSLNERNISLIKYVGLLANAMEADIVISPGKVSFVPRQL